MFLLQNWKIYVLGFVLISSLALNSLQRYQNSRLLHENEIYKNNLLAIELGSAARDAQNRLTEQEAADAQAESIKRGHSTLQDEIPGGCQGAIDYGIRKAGTFNWHNNIP